MIGIFRKRKTQTGDPATHGRKADLNVPLQDTSYVVLDTELTGLDRKKDSIISIGAVRMTGGRIEMGQTFYQLVNPNTEMRKETVVIHQITPSEVLEKPSIDPVISDFFDFCGNGVLMGHYITIDLAFIQRELKRVLGRTLKNPALDTLTLVDWLRWNTPSNGTSPLNPKNLQLYEIAKDLDIPVQGAHNALMDAFMTAQVFQRLLPRLEECGIRTLGELLRVGNPSRKLHQPETLI